jgi:hypothetical protein
MGCIWPIQSGRIRPILLLKSHWKRANVKESQRARPPNPPIQCELDAWGET